VGDRQDASDIIVFERLAMRLQGKVAVITGAARGIGRATAIRFAKEGARVVINDINAVAGETLFSEITASGGAALFLRGDAASEGDVATLMRTANEAFGNLHILVNNAVPSMEEIGSNRWDTTVQVGLKSYWLCMQAAIPWMRLSGSGSIVNISSVNALMGLGNDHVYSGVKAAILGLSRSMVGEFSPFGLRINCICPGTIVTEIWKPLFDRDPDLPRRLSALYPIGRLGCAEDIANAALFLASDEASFITGSVLTVDGGLTAANLSFSK
jgi:NAD(P)-dependent dehydrogenase (short-subunit alcohol dehydrogenase family)